jgi:hypothetical protein
MKKTPTEKRAAIASSELLAVERPPRNLPDGSWNPAYGRWYYRQNRERVLSNVKRFKQTEKGRAIIKKYNRSEAAKLATARYSAKVKCIECGIEYRKEDVNDRGYRKIGRNKCVCDLCG